MDYKMQSLKNSKCDTKNYSQLTRIEYIFYRHIGWILGKYKLHDKIKEYNIGLHRIVF
jgi:hypothetical protein